MDRDLRRKPRAAPQIFGRRAAQHSQLGFRTSSSNQSSLGTLFEFAFNPTRRASLARSSVKKVGFRQVGVKNCQLAVLPCFASDSDSAASAELGTPCVVQSHCWRTQKVTLAPRQPPASSRSNC